MSVFIEGGVYCSELGGDTAERGTVTGAPGSGGREGGLT